MSFPYIVNKALGTITDQDPEDNELKEKATELASFYMTTDKLDTNNALVYLLRMKGNNPESAAGYIKEKTIDELKLEVEGVMAEGGRKRRGKKSRKSRKGKKPRKGKKSRKNKRRTKRR